MRLSECGISEDYLEFSCSRQGCARRGRYAIQRLLQAHGDLELHLLMPRIAASCSRQVPGQRLTELCGIRCPTLLKLAGLAAR